MLQEEPSLDYLLAEPIVRRLMRVDGISEDDVLWHADQARRALLLAPVTNPLSDRTRCADPGRSR